jgi:hypothetical protein
MAFWMNDELGHEQTGMHWRDVPELQLNKAWLQHYIADGDADQSNRVWFDDVVVSTQRIGCGGAPPGGDETGPAAEEGGGEAGSTGGGTAGAETTSGGAGPGSGASGSASAGSGAASDSDTDGEAQGSDSDGCGCRAPRAPGSAAWILPLVLLGGYFRPRGRAGAPEGLTHWPSIKISARRRAFPGCLRAR